MIEATQSLLVEAILEADRDRATSLLEGWANRYSLEKAIQEILEPALHTIGERWETTHSVSLAQGYVAGKIAEDFMLKAAGREQADALPAPSKGPVVIGNIEDDHHSLGRKMVGVFLKCSGWQVYDLGNDVLAGEFVAKAAEVGATIIGVSAMMYSTAMNIRALRAEIDKSELAGKVRLAVGGAVFRLRPELVAEVGGDGTAGNALQVSALFDRLAGELATKERGL